MSLYEFYVFQKELNFTYELRKPPDGDWGETYLIHF